MRSRCVYCIPIRTKNAWEIIKSNSISAIWKYMYGFGVAVNHIVRLLIWSENEEVVQRKYFYGILNYSLVVYLPSDKHRHGQQTDNLYLLSECRHHLKIEFIRICRTYWLLVSYWIKYINFIPMLVIYLWSTDNENISNINHWNLEHWKSIVNQALTATSHSNVHHVRCGREYQSAPKVQDQLHEVILMI